MSRTIRLCTVLLALTFLAGGAARAMPLDAHPQTAPEGLFQAAWEWITDLFLGGDRQAKDAGCEMDPNGRPCRASTNAFTLFDPSASDAGIEMDPNG